jgi:hypothetical protein
MKPMWPVKAVTLLLVVGLASSCAPADRSSDAQLEDAPTVMAEADFGSLSPLAPGETAQWGQLAGVWECLVSTPVEGGPARSSRATWTWRYTLDGHAVQDVYVGHREDDRPDFYGTGIRIYHPGNASWEISWMANSAASGDAPRITPFTATFEDEEIVMRRGDDPAWRTTFFDMDEESFSWASEPSGQTMTCTRDSG